MVRGPEDFPAANPDCPACIRRPFIISVLSIQFADPCGDRIREWRRTPGHRIDPHQHDLAGGQARAFARFAQGHQHVQPLGIVVDQPNIDEQRLSLVRLGEIADMGLERKRRIAMRRTGIRAKAQPLQERVGRLAEHAGKGRIVHVAVVIDPFRADRRPIAGEGGRSSAHVRSAPRCPRPPASTR